MNNVMFLCFTFLLVPVFADIPTLSQQFEIRYELETLFTALDGEVGQFVRLAFHDAGTFSALDNSGGSHACMMFPTEHDNPQNVGLHVAQALLQPTVDQWSTFGISVTDIWQFAGVVAVGYADGPEIPFQWGRSDCLEDEGVEPGRLPIAEPDPTGPNAVVCPERMSCECGPGCWEELRTNLQIDVFERMGFSNPRKAMVALTGAHTIGHVSEMNSGYNTSSWTSNPNHFDNEYYTNLLDNNWSIYEFDEFHHQATSGDGNNMLVSDLLFKYLGCDISPEDPNICSIAQSYAEDNELFRSDFGKYYTELISFGHSSLQFAICDVAIGNGISLLWTFNLDRREMSFTLKVPKRNVWIGFGFSSAGLMEGSDVTIFDPASVDPDGAEDKNFTLSEYKIIGQDPTSLEQTLQLKETQELTNIEWTEDDISTLLKFTHPTVSSDGHDIILQSNAHVIWAYGTNSKLGYHGINYRGSAEVDFGDCQEEQSSPVGVPAPSVPVPAPSEYFPSVPPTPMNSPSATASQAPETSEPDMYFPADQQEEEEELDAFESGEFAFILYFIIVVCSLLFVIGFGCCMYAICFKSHRRRGSRNGDRSDAAEMTRSYHSPTRGEFRSEHSPTRGEFRSEYSPTRTQYNRQQSTASSVVA